MTQAQLLDRIRTSASLRRLTGKPEHWLTTLHAGFWGINRVPGNVSAWQALSPGSLCFFHAEGTPGYAPLSPGCATSGIIGVGAVSHLGRKTTLEWIAEIENGHNGWPNLIYFEQIWWFTQVGDIDIEPIRAKLQRSTQALEADVARLTRDGLRFGEIEQETGYRFPVQGSISGLQPSPDAQDALAELVGESITAVQYFGDGQMHSPEAPVVSDVDTDTYETTSRARLGQSAFSDRVRENFGHRCCFPGCDVADDRYLIGAHIARWADEPGMRGEVSNGLCLCLLHDRAFEVGHFTLTADRRVYATDEKTAGSRWAQANLLPFVGEEIAEATTPPHPVAMKKHRERHGYAVDG